MKIYFALACCLCSAGSWAQEKKPPPPPQILQAPHADPYVPPEKRIAPSQPPASGAALQEQALQKLKKQFERRRRFQARRHADRRAGARRGTRLRRQKF